MSSSRPWIAAPVSALLLACAPEPASTAAPATAAPTTVETCLLGPLELQVQQRMVQDDGITALLEEQRIGDVAVLFAAQKQVLADRPGVDANRPDEPRRVPPAPLSQLLLVRGAMVTEELDDLEYVPHPDGAKPTQTRTTRKSYTYFLADAVWDCQSAAAEIDAIGLPRGQASASACVPPELRARCRDLAAAGDEARNPAAD